MSAPVGNILAVQSWCSPSARRVAATLVARANMVTTGGGASAGSQPSTSLRLLLHEPEPFHMERRAWEGALYTVYVIYVRCTI